MAEPARKLPTPTRQPNSVPTVRQLGNMPRQSGDTERALSYLRDRQRPANQNSGQTVLPTLSNPALQPQEEENDEDIYGAEQKASDSRMQAIHSSGANEEYSDEEEVYPEEPQQNEYADEYAYEQEYDDRQTYDAPQSIEERDQQNAIAFARSQANFIKRFLQEKALQDADTDDETEKNRKAMARKAGKKWLKATMAGTGIGLLAVFAIWNYEVFIEGKQPAWKILLTILVDIVSILSMIWVIIQPIVFFLAVFAAARAILPEPIRAVFDNALSSVLQ
ncbi:MAG: YrdB family protein [Candidatus Magasanikbacteria bacterium]|nr:YrdB family protein [Candidatus Magasanikbacteria bacterium]